MLTSVEYMGSNISMANKKGIIMKQIVCLCLILLLASGCITTNFNGMNAVEKEGAIKQNIVVGTLISMAIALKINDSQEDDLSNYMMPIFFVSGATFVYYDSKMELEMKQYYDQLSQEYHESEYNYLRDSWEDADNKRDRYITRISDFVLGAMVYRDISYSLANSKKTDQRVTTLE